MADGQRRDPELAVVVDDNGKLQAQFGGDGAKEEAGQFLKDCGGRVNHLRGASIVTGEDAKKAIQNGRI